MPGGCDDGNIIDGDGCTASCKVQAFWTCPVFNNRSRCVPICGDSMRVGAEALSTGCDDGNTFSSDGCSSSCVVERLYLCTGALISTCSGSCGNGIQNVEAGEECDTGSVGSDRGCLSSCRLELGFNCVTAPNKTTNCTAVCGNGYVNG